MDTIRVDKFIWSVRLFKTRTLASEECKKGRVLVNEQPAKASKNVEVGDIVSIKQNPIYRKYKIIKLLKSRVGAKLVPDYIEEITSEDDLFKLKLFQDINNNQSGKRERGTGRPTKKERRDLDNLMK